MVLAHFLIGASGAAALAFLISRSWGSAFFAGALWIVSGPFLSPPSISGTTSRGRRGCRGYSRASNDCSEPHTTARSRTWRTVRDADTRRFGRLVRHDRSAGPAPPPLRRPRFHCAAFSPAGWRSGGGGDSARHWGRRLAARSRGCARRGAQRAQSRVANRLVRAPRGGDRTRGSDPDRSASTQPRTNEASHGQSPPAA